MTDLTAGASMTQPMSQLAHSLATLAAAALLAFASSVSAQAPPCAQLPAAEREPARLAGRCVGLAPIIDLRPPAADRAVPNVVGLAYDDARERLFGFDVQRSYRSSLQPGGTVIAQDPPPGRVLAGGAAVRITLSDGTQRAVPGVIGLNVKDARQRLASQGDLKPQTSVVASAAPAGTVIAQQPNEGEAIQRGGIVRLQVSAGVAAATQPQATAAPQLVEVPNVVGLPGERAISELGRFRIERRTQPSGRPAGVVLQQTPTGRAPPGSTVTIVVSSGRWTEVYEMPEVVGRTGEDAESLLAEFTIERSPVASTAPRGQVLSQNPSPGASVTPGSAVRLQVSDGSLVRVPDVAQQTLADARALASQLLGLRLVIAGGAERADAKIVAQDPPAGSDVARGSDLVVTLAASGRSLGDRITGSDTTRRNLDPGALGVLFVVLLLVTLMLVWRRRRFSGAVAPVAAAPHVAPDWVAAARVEPIADSLPHVTGATPPRGPEVGIDARVERGPITVHVDER